MKHCKQNKESLKGAEQVKNNGAISYTMLLLCLSLKSISWIDYLLKTADLTQYKNQESRNLFPKKVEHKIHNE